MLRAINNATHNYEHSESKTVVLCLLVLTPIGLPLVIASILSGLLDRDHPERQRRRQAAASTPRSVPKAPEAPSRQDLDPPSRPAPEPASLWPHKPPTEPYSASTPSSASSSIIS